MSNAAKVALAASSYDNQYKCHINNNEFPTQQSYSNHRLMPRVPSYFQQQQQEVEQDEDEFVFSQLCDAKKFRSFNEIE